VWWVNNYQILMEARQQHSLVDKELQRIRCLLFRLLKPKAFTIQIVSEREEDKMDVLSYIAMLPVIPEGADVAVQVFAVLVDGEPCVVPVGGVPTPQSKELSVNAATADFDVPQDANVELELTYKDDAGNMSQGTLTQFVATDTIPPEAPGEFGEITLISERKEEDPAPPD